MCVAPDGDEVELADLGRHRVSELGPSVARVDTEERREAVEVAVAVVIPDVAALTAHDDRNLVVGPERAHPCEVHPEVTLSLLLKRACLGLSGSRGAGRCCHRLLLSLASPYNATPRRLGLQAELCEISLE